MKNNVFNLHRFVLFAFCFVLLNTKTTAQPKSELVAPKIVFGSPSIKELETKTCSLDSTADAAILFDSRDVFYNTTSGETDITVHRRIKIFKKANVDLADYLCTYYSKRLQMHNAQGFVYLPDPQKGYVIKPFDLNNLATQESYTEGRRRVCITPPDVKDGCVIEFKFIITGYGVWLSDHYFQFGVPTYWSEVHYKLPYEVQYDASLKNPNNGTLVYKDVKGVNQNTGDDDHADIYINLAYANVPALKSEPYIYSESRYQTYLDMTEKSYFPQGKPKQLYSTSISDGGKELYNCYNYEKIYRSYPVIKEIAATVLKGVTDKSDTLACARAAIEWVKINIKENNEFNDIKLEENLAYIIKEKKGTYDEINYVLFNLLREMGFGDKVGLVLLKPRSNGKLDEKSLVSDCTHAVAFMNIGGKDQYLDAANTNGRFGMLNPALLNNKALYILKEKELLLQDCKVSDKFQHVVQLETELDAAAEKANFNGKIIKGSYAALALRDNIKESGEPKYRDRLKNSIDGLDITEVKFDNLAELEKSPEINIKGNVTTIATFLDGRILVKSPFPYFEKNPFIDLKRVNPVDFGSPLALTVNHSIKIPAGYVIESLPKSESTTLPDGDAKFTYTTEEKDGAAKISIRLNVNQTLFVVEKYEALRRFFEAASKKAAEEVVFKKQ